MYVGGASHPLRAPCLEIPDLVATRRLDAVTSAEVIQEIFHRFARSPRAAEGAELAQATLDLFSPVLPITHGVVARMPDLARRYPTHSARDLIHVATCLAHGIEAVVSPDTDFDRIREVRRIAPDDPAGLSPHLRR
jgi:predicted nucleic acid-binding protein